MFASRSHARALAALFPHTDRVWITTDHLVRFYKNEFDEMSCKMNFTKNPRLFKKYPNPTLKNTQPYLEVGLGIF